MKDADVEKANLQDWPLPDEYLTELGRLAAAWSSLETGLDTYIGRLAGFNLDDPRAFILLKHSSLPQKLDNLAALCDHLAPSYPWLSNYNTTIAAIREAQRNRNRFMHNALSLNHETNRLELAVGSARGKLKTAVESVDLNDIKRAAMLAHTALLSLHSLVTQKSYPPMWEVVAG
jgi:hypothetical protein